MMPRHVPFFRSSLSASVLAAASLAGGCWAPAAHAGWSASVRVSTISKWGPGWAQLASDDRGDAIVLATRSRERPEAAVLEAATRSPTRAWSQPTRLAAGSPGPTEEHVVMGATGEATVVWLEQAPRPRGRELTKVKARVHLPDTGWGQTVVLASWTTRKELSDGGLEVAQDGRRGLVVAYSRDVLHRDTVLQTLTLRRRDQRGRWSRARIAAAGTEGIEGFELAVDRRGEVTLLLRTEFGTALQALVLSRSGAVLQHLHKLSLTGRNYETALAGNQAGEDTVAWQVSTGEEEGCPGPIYAVTRPPGARWGRPTKIATEACLDDAFVAPTGAVTVTLAGTSLGPAFASRGSSDAWTLTPSPLRRAPDTWASDANGELAGAGSRRTYAEYKAGSRETIEVVTDDGGMGWRVLPALYPAGDMAVVALADDGTVTVAWREFSQPEGEGSPSWTEVATYTP
jgi:hypothetical protein